MPTWLDQLTGRLGPLPTSWSGGDQPRAAVLALLNQAVEPDVVLTVRAATLQHHAGQVSFPGGRAEDGDATPTRTALRETYEEIGLAPSAVTPLGRLVVTVGPPGGEAIVPVVGLWSGHEAITAQDPAEVAMVGRWAVTELADPANRVMASHPYGGYSPAWQLDDLFLWGMTGILVDDLLWAGGWAEAWDTSRVVEVPERFW